MSEQGYSFRYRKVYVAAPARTPSGGPELSQQLVHTLREQGVEAYIYYYYREEGVDPVYEEFKAYNNPYVDDIDDCPDNLLVVPETKTILLSEYASINKAIWWMSVDFYYTMLGFPLEDHRVLANPFWRFFKLLGKSRKARRHFYFGRRGDQNILHLVQSHYARDHLKGKGVKERQILHLSDYLNADFIRESAREKTREKRDIVVYNPKKGLEFTRTLIEAMPDVEFIPLQNMRRSEVVELLQSAKLYIDFGEHPGKDRIPREACISGACIITGRNGAAKFSGDLPIPDEFKFERAADALPCIVEQVYRCLREYDALRPSFEPYREMIRNEEAAFRKDAAQLV